MKAIFFLFNKLMSSAALNVQAFQNQVDSNCSFFLSFISSENVVVTVIVLGVNGPFLLKKKLDTNETTDDKKYRALT